jgi:sporulation protein YlmC with PRC-barrel domain
MSAEVNIELLIGCKVYDAEGRKIGRIEEVLAVEKGDELVVSEYHVGTEGLMERLSAYNIGVGLIRLLGARGHAADPKRIPWQELDLSDPRKPVWRKR